MGLLCRSYSACHWTPSAKRGRVGDADRLDRAVLGDALDDDALARLEDALAVQRVHADRIAAEQPGEGAVLGQPHLVAIGEHHFRIGMDLAVLQPRHAVVHAAGNVADLRMQRAAEGHVHLLQAAADVEQRRCRARRRP